MTVRWRSPAARMAACAPLLLVLALAAALPDHVRTLVCRYSGAAMDPAACCPLSMERDARVEARLRGEACCSVKTVDLDRLVSEHRSEGATPRPFAVRSLLPRIELSVRPGRPAVRDVTPPGVGPPLLLLKRSFLI